MGSGLSIPVFRAEEKGVLTAQLYKLCAQRGAKLPIKTCRQFTEKVLVICPWVKPSGLQPHKWQAVGQQMASYNQTCPGFLSPEDFRVFKIVAAAVTAPDPPPLPCSVSTQCGASLAGSDSEGSGGHEESKDGNRNYRPKYPWGDLEKVARESAPVLSESEEEETARFPRETRRRRERAQNPGKGVHPRVADDREDEGWRSPLPPVPCSSKMAPLETPHVEGWGPLPPPSRNHGGPLPEVTTPPSYCPQGAVPPSAGEGLLRRSLRLAAEAGAEVDFDSWDMFPILTDPLTGGRTHAPIQYKALKDFKESVTTYGPASPYVKKLLANLVAAHPWTPADFDGLAVACLEPSTYLAYQAQLRREARRIAPLRPQRAPQDTEDLICGTGHFANPAVQLAYGHADLDDVQEAHMRAWEKASVRGQGSGTKLVGLKQRPGQSPLSFVNEVQETVHRSIGEGRAMEPLIRQLVKEGLRSREAAAVNALPSDAPLSDIVDKLMDLPPDDPLTQSAAAAASRDNALVQALEKLVLASAERDSNILAAVQRLSSDPAHAASKVCFGCGQSGHFKAQCHAIPRKSSPKCFACGRPGHVAKYCRLKNPASSPLRPLSTPPGMPRIPWLPHRETGGGGGRPPFPLRSPLRRPDLPGSDGPSSWDPLKSALPPPSGGANNCPCLLSLLSRTSYWSGGPG
ncbi:endogenous retrovirus group K member 9 Gag polyprotein-like [Petaurus breviceps papuanus]|uniref:endogenous retrovirus group K member 9 Gag polyprotein-like n=1 Tax=Petaurus breviceps papuanus TaxID=3040969 RepID=UPI0036D7AD37